MSTTQPLFTSGKTPDRSVPRVLVPARRWWSLAVKRAVDVVGSFLGLLLFSPVLLLVALLVKLEDGGPVFYRRAVVGPRGQFKAFKVRSMRADADAILANNAGLRRAFEQNFKLKHDPRVTSIGAQLRKFSIDELPQLFNVLLGEMSLVGPRMITATELEKYGEYQDLLLSVRPGLTGHWQVNGRQEVSYAERVRMDIEYIREWTLRKDFQILLRTPLCVLRGRGAY
jgi:exopolysaccharide production protein ExoY